MKKYVYLALLLPAVALAESSTSSCNCFAGLSTGWQVAEDQSYDNEAPNNYLLGVYGGIYLNPGLSIDLGYQHFGELEAKATKVEIETYLFRVLVRYKHSITQDLHVYGGGGIARWRVAKQEPKGGLSAESGSPLLDAGLGFALSPVLSTRMGYQYIDEVGDDLSGAFDSHAVYVGLEYKFGQSVN